MVVVNQKLIGDESESKFSVPNIPVGIFFENEVNKNIAEYGNSTWLTDASINKSMSYVEMMRRIRSVASGLRKRGLLIGDNVLVISSNCIEVPLMTLGVWRAGGSQACLGVNLPPDVIEKRLREIGSKFVLVDRIRAGRMVEVVKRIPSVCDVFVIGDIVVPGCTPFEVLLHDAGDECPKNLDEVDMDSTAWLVYTSGTTGISKAVIKTQRTVISSIIPWRNIGGTKRSTFLVLSPMIHTAGLLLIMALSLDYMEAYCLSEFSEENLLSCVDRFKPRGLTLGPPLIAWMCRFKNTEKYDLSSVNVIVSVGSQINPNFEREIFNKLSNLKVINNLYGMTETGIICRTSSSRQSELLGLSKDEAIAGNNFGSVGRTVAGCKIKIIDAESGAKLGPNQIGEICIKSPFMLKEYLNKPEETAIFLRKGWAHSGDKGYFDINENVFVVGRYKELIKYRNNHVVPNNVEKYLITHPAVHDAAVVGLPDDVHGELPCAFVVLSSSCQHVTANELISFTNERVMEEEKLRGGVRFIDNIPRNDLGKIIRPLLANLLIENKKFKF